MEKSPTKSGGFASVIPDATACVASLFTRVLIDLMAIEKVSAVGHLPNYMSSFSEDQSAICGALFRVMMGNDSERSRHCCPTVANPAEEAVPVAK